METNFVNSCLVCAEQIINADGSLVVLKSYAGDYWVVDLKAKRFRHKLPLPEGATRDPDCHLGLGTISLDGERLVHLLSKSHEEFRSKEEILYPAIWDLRTGLLSSYRMGRYHVRDHALDAGEIFSELFFGVRVYIFCTVSLTLCDCGCYRRPAPPDGGRIGPAQLGGQKFSHELQPYWD